MSSAYLENIKKEFLGFKSLGERAMEQLSYESLFWQYNPQSNSIAIIVQHLHGNMLSRWTNFLSEDGEKQWRERDMEFEKKIETKAELDEKWAAGWNCLFDALGSLESEDLNKIIYIRKKPQTVIEAINHQLGHYAYHVGQIIYAAKMQAGSRWVSLSIPKAENEA